MAKFIITATITVEGDDIQSEKSALNELQIMLNDYDDMNGDYDNSICINTSEIKKVA